MSDKQALLLAVLTSFTWGLTGIFVRLLPAISPLSLTAMRLMIALLVILPLLFVIRDMRRCLTVTLKQVRAYLLALLLAGYYLLATAAFQLAPVAEVALLLSTPPVFVLVLRKWRGDTITRREIGGVLLALGGVCIILYPKLSQNADYTATNLAGSLLAICAALFTALYAYSYRAMAEHNRAPETTGVTLLTFAAGSGLLVLLAVLSPHPLAIAQFTTDTWLIMLALGVISTAIPSLGFALVSKRLPAMITSTILLLIPVFAAVFALLILDEALSPVFLGGCVLVLGGVAMITYRRRRVSSAN